MLRISHLTCHRIDIYSIVEELAGFGASIHMCSRNQKEINERLVGMDGNRIKELLESEFICSTSSFFFKFLFSFEFGKICFEYALHLNDFSALEFHKVQMFFTSIVS
uniref:Uncharacterized protein n=1 Tax=Lactuca sativa TaxID=4236 RepID=A0A9R1VVW0_LACSA|nr:hypothetical protein LSAT_V11C400186760 [Lactuca sativa]